MYDTANVKEVEAIVISDLTEKIDFELEEDVGVTLDDFLVDANDLNITIIDGV